MRLFRGFSFSGLGHAIILRKNFGDKKIYFLEQIKSLNLPFESKIAC